MRRSRRKFQPTINGLERRVVLSTITVTNTNDSGAGSLRAAIASAHNGDTVQFAMGLTGPIELTSGELDIAVSLTIQGPGATTPMTISGSSNGRVFNFTNTSATDTLASLIITDGLIASGNGAGMFSQAATLNINNSTIENNQIQDTTVGDTPAGAGLYATGNVLITSTTFQNNVLSSSGSATGGAVAAQGKSLSIKSSQFVQNSIEATDSLPSTGGAVYYNAGSAASPTLTLSSDTFNTNTAKGNSDTKSNLNGSNVFGGAVAIEVGTSSSASIAVTRSTFTGNSVLAYGTVAQTTNGGNAFGGSIFLDAGSATNPSIKFARDTVTNSTAQSQAGTNFSGEALGGGIELETDGATGGTYTLNFLKITGSSALGGDGSASGAGAAGGAGYGGGLDINVGNPSGSTINMSNLTLTGDNAIGGIGANGDPTVEVNNIGGEGGAGGYAAGGGLSVFGGPVTSLSLSLTHSTISQDQATGGGGGAGGGYTSNIQPGPGGGGAGGEGGGISVYLISTANPTLTVTSTTIEQNTAQSGTGGAGGTGDSLNHPGGDGASSNTALGGGVSVELYATQNASVTFSSDHVGTNTAIAGTGGAGGNGSIGAGGGASGIAWGGGFYLSSNQSNGSAGTVTLNKVTVSGNEALGGAGGAGGNTGPLGYFGGSGGEGEGGVGGGVYSDLYGGALALVGGAITTNTATDGTGGTGGTGPSGTGSTGAITVGDAGGVYVESGTTATRTSKTVINNNTSTDNPNIDGTITLV